MINSLPVITSGRLSQLGLESQNFTIHDGSVSKNIYSDHEQIITNCLCQNQTVDTWLRIQCSQCLVWTHTACEGYFSKSSEKTFDSHICISCRFELSTEQLDKISDVYIFRRALFTLIWLPPKNIRQYANDMDIKISFATQLFQRMEGNT